ncbi:zinc-binding dehydrogenase [Sphingobium ummariense]
MMTNRLCTGDRQNSQSVRRFERVPLIGSCSADFIRARDLGSIWALQIAKMFGATAVITSSSDEKLERAELLGADHVLNYRTVSDWGKAVRDRTGGWGVDLVLEVGGSATMAQSAEAVRIGGHIAMIEGLAGYEGGLPVLAMMMKQARAQGLIVGSRKQQQDFVRAIDANGLRPVIDRRFHWKSWQTLSGARSPAGISAKSASSGSGRPTLSTAMSRDAYSDVQ